MTPLIQPRRAKSITVMPADILRPEKSVLTMSDAELNKIDSFQNQNRGFKDFKDYGDRRITFFGRVK